jgi:hypothetical protein
VIRVDRSPIAAFALAFFLFGIGFVVSGCLTFALATAGQPRGRLDLSPNVGMAVYLILVTGTGAAAGFSVVAAAARGVRSLSRGSLAALGIAAGVVSYLAQLTGLAQVLAFRVTPRGLGACGAVLQLLLPGLVAGLLAAVALRLLRPATARPPGSGDDATLPSAK